MKFNPTRLTIARNRRLLNKKNLARISGISQRTIVRCEKGDSEPTRENVEAFSRVLSYPVGFFFRGDIEDANPEITSFRSLASMTAAIRNAALSAGSIGFEISDWIEDKFTLPPAKVPDLSTFESPAAAARVLREEWGLGERPISSMFQLLESKGIRVFSLCENTAKVDAYSIWRSEQPFIFLNTYKSSERSRFDAGHELGHLVLHQDGATKGRLAEDQANAFASAFLMPEGDIFAHATTIRSLGQLIELKKRWKVSLVSLCYRLHKLGLLSDWKYKDFSISIATSGFNRNEPDGIEREQSVVWKKVMQELWGEQKTYFDIADDLDLPVDEVEGLLFGILGNGEAPLFPDGEAPPLRLVSW